ncbi:MAG: acyl--CoA ligase [bacterium]|nr:acyl--CoA ligase [bacterium]
MSDPTLVHHLIERHAAAAPDQEFVIHSERCGSYGDVDREANRTARVLQSQGLSPGDRVGLLSRNSLLFVESFYGILKAGGVAVLLNTASKGAALSRLLEDCGASGLIVGAGSGSQARQAMTEDLRLDWVLEEPGQAKGEFREGQPHLDLLEARATHSSQALDLALDETSLAAIIYTSGSTGESKGVMLTHRNLLSNTRSIVSYLDLQANDRVLSVLPFFYVYGLSLLNTHAYCGGSLVIENQTLYPNVMLDTLESEGCTGFSGVPSNFAILLNRSTFVEREMAQLRYVTQAGGSMGPDLTRRLMAALPGREIFIMYGATEASARLAYLPPSMLREKIGSIGRAIPEVDLRLITADGREAETGEVGEIIASGPNIMVGYWNDRVATDEVLDGLGYHTGDLAYRDDDGFFFIVGRKRDFIKAGAHRVSAKEIEEAILSLGDSHEVAVIGVPDETMGERIRAFVVPLDGRELEERAIIKALRAILSPHKVPSEVHFRDGLPKSEAGKVLKGDLR